MRGRPYAGQSDTNDFHGLTLDEMTNAMHEYTLLGECFETLTDEEMFGRVWMTENPHILVEDHADNLRRAQRELAGAVALGRSQGKNCPAVLTTSSQIGSRAASKGPRWIPAFGSCSTATP
jgi:hypothetical protein